MWIMLNNKPLDISRIENISGVIKLDSKYYLSHTVDLSRWGRAEVDLIHMKLPNELVKKSIKDIQADKEKKNTTWGYFFYISVRTYRQCYLNNAENGVNLRIEKIPSRVYETEQQAKTALEYLLSEMNEVLNKLVKVEI